MEHASCLYQRGSVALVFVAVEHLGKTELAISILREVYLLSFCNSQFFCGHYGFAGQ